MTMNELCLQAVKVEESDRVTQLNAWAPHNKSSCLIDPANTLVGLIDSLSSWPCLTSTRFASQYDRHTALITTLNQTHQIIWIE